MPNLRGRTDRKHHRREQERSGSDRDAESDDEFDFGSAEEAEGRFAEESMSGRGGSCRKKEPKSANHGGDEGNKGEEAKIEDELETSNSDKSGDESETADSVRMFDSEMPNQLKAKRKKGQQKRRQHCDRMGAGKGRTSRQAD